MTNDEWIYGWHAVRAMIKHDIERIREVFILQGRIDNQAVVEQLTDQGVAVHSTARDKLDRMTNHATHQGIVARVAPQVPKTWAFIDDLIKREQEKTTLLILDGVQDPHNLGACLRTANASGVHAVIVAKDRQAPLSPVARKAAAGAAETTPIVVVTNLARTLDDLKERNVWIYGLAGEATESIYESTLTGAIAFVLGSEGKGLRRLTRERCDVLLRIPMLGEVGSLNVSVATGIVCYERVRQCHGQ